MNEHVIIEGIETARSERLAGARLVHLRVRSEHSVGSSVLRPGEIAARAEQLGMPTIGLADVGTLCGAFGFYREAIALGVKPIFGAELTVGDARVLFLAKNRAGWRELATFVTRSAQGTLDVAMIAAKGSNLVAVDCPGQGIVARIFETGDRVDAASAAMSLQRVMPPGSFFLGIGCAGLDGPSALDAEIRELARAIGVGIALAIPIGRPEQLISAAEALSAFPGFEDAVAGTARIAKLCGEPFSIAGPLGPFPCPREMDPKTASERFARLAVDGLALRLDQLRAVGHATDEAVYRARFETELALVRERRLETLFLNAANVAALCRDRGILLGPGCTEMPSSLLLFVLGVTDIDPIAHGLHFEMFFNSDRAALPDIVFEVETGRERELLAEIANRFMEVCAMPATRAERDVGTGLATRHVASPTRLVVCGSGVFDHVAVMPDSDTSRQARADVLEEDAPMFGFWTVDVVPDDALAAIRAALRAKGVPDDKVPDFPLFFINDEELIAHSPPGFSHPALAPFLPETDGVLYWQEQILTIISEFSGMTLARADLLRRELAGASKLSELREDFLQKTVERGRRPAEVEEILRVLSGKVVHSTSIRSRELALALSFCRCVWMEGSLGNVT